MATWLEQIDSILECPGGFENVTQVNNYIVLQKLLRLLQLNPTALDADTETNKYVKFLQAEILCGNIQEEFVVKKLDAIIEAKLTATATVADQLINSGIYTSTGTATSQNISVPGLVATDVVTVTLHTQAGSELVTKAIAGTNIITVTFSAAPTTGTKVNWSAYRPKN